MLKYFTLLICVMKYETLEKNFKNITVHSKNKVSKLEIDIIIKPRKIIVYNGLE